MAGQKSDRGGGNERYAGWKRTAVLAFLKYYRYMEKYGAVCIGSQYSNGLFFAMERKPDGTIGKRNTPPFPPIRLTTREDIFRYETGFDARSPHHYKIDEYVQRTAIVEFADIFQADGALLAGWRCGVGCTLTRKEQAMRLREADTASCSSREASRASAPTSMRSASSTSWTHGWRPGPQKAGGLTRKAFFRIRKAQCPGRTSVTFDMIREEEHERADLGDEAPGDLAEAKELRAKWQKSIESKERWSGRATTPGSWRFRHHGHRRQSGGLMIAAKSNSLRGSAAWLRDPRLGPGDLRLPRRLLGQPVSGLSDGRQPVSDAQVCGAHPCVCDSHTKRGEQVKDFAPVPAG
jgi:hypothetical protein